MADTPDRAAAVGGLVDMTNRLRAHLYDIVRNPEEPEARRAEARSDLAKLVKFDPRGSAPAPKNLYASSAIPGAPTADEQIRYLVAEKPGRLPGQPYITAPLERGLQAPPRPGPIAKAYAEEGLSGAIPEAVLQGAAQVPRATEAGLTKFNETVSLGYWPKATDALGLTTPGGRAQLEEEHPFASGLGMGAGYLTPGGGPAQLSRAGAAAAGPVAARLAPRLGRIASKIVGLAPGAAGGALVSGAEAVAAGAPAAEVGRRAGAGAAGGAAFQGVGQLAGAGARAIRGGRGPIGEDIRVLEGYGGRKAVKGMGMEGDPAERGRLSKGAADTIASDLDALAKRYADELETSLQRQFQGPEGVAVKAMADRVAQIDKFLGDPLTPQTKARLADLRRYLTEGSMTPQSPGTASTIPSSPDVIQGGARSDLPTSRVPELGRTEVTTPPRVPAIEAPRLNQTRDLADQYAGLQRQEGLSKEEAVIKQVADGLRADLRQVAPGAAQANARYSEQLAPVEKARSLGGIGGKLDPADVAQLNELGLPLDANSAFALRLARQGQRTATAGIDASRLEALRENYPGTAQAGALMDAPRLSLALERQSLGARAIPFGQGKGQAAAHTLSEPVVARGVYPGLRRLEGIPAGQAGSLLGAARKMRRERDERRKGQAR